MVESDHLGSVPSFLLCLHVAEDMVELLEEFLGLMGATFLVEVLLLVFLQLLLFVLGQLGRLAFFLALQLLGEAVQCFVGGFAASHPSRLGGLRRLHSFGRRPRDEVTFIVKLLF